MVNLQADLIDSKKGEHYSGIRLCAKVLGPLENQSCPFLWVCCHPEKWQNRSCLVSCRKKWVVSGTVCKVVAEDGSRSVLLPD